MAAATAMPLDGVRVIDFSALLPGRSPPRLLAAALLEQRSWNSFCTVIYPPDDLRDDARDPAATQRVVAQIIASESAAQWHERFAGHDCCCNLVVSP